jgi:hypothetical protein
MHPAPSRVDVLEMLFTALLFIGQFSSTRLSTPQGQDGLFQSQQFAWDPEQMDPKQINEYYY